MNNSCSLRESLPSNQRGRPVLMRSDLCLALSPVIQCSLRRVRHGRGGSRRVFGLTGGHFLCSSRPPRGRTLQVRSQTRPDKAGVWSCLAHVLDLFIFGDPTAHLQNDAVTDSRGINLTAASHRSPSEFSLSSPCLLLSGHGPRGVDGKLTGRKWHSTSGGTSCDNLPSQLPGDSREKLQRWPRVTERRAWGREAAAGEAATGEAAAGESPCLFIHAQALAKITLSIQGWVMNGPRPLHATRKL